MPQPPRRRAGRSGPVPTFRRGAVSCLTDAMTQSDAELVDRARSGDPLAFGVLVQRHLRAARAVALAVTMDEADAEDVSQDAFITALERLEQCRQPAAFRGWLLTIVRNLARNRVRDEGRRRTVPLEDTAPVAAKEGAGRRLEQAELRDRLLEALGELPEVQRQVVLLHDLEGWKHREIGASLGMAEGTCRAHLSHARRTLRARLAAYVDEED
jgi:RNA polymerase sigma-70 factor, ECF subfamily